MKERRKGEKDNKEKIEIKWKGIKANEYWWEREEVVRIDKKRGDNGRQESGTKRRKWSGLNSMEL